jgi:hypothetical protein
MKRAREISLLAAITFWATIIGAVMYSHVVFLSAYLPNLPASTSLLSGPYGIHDENFWIPIHPLCIIALVITLVLNWNLLPRRKYILATLILYIIVLVITFIYFVPELQAFASSHQSNLPAAQWIERGTRWEKLSWIRGFFMYCGFVLLLMALVKNRFQRKDIRL